MPIRYLLYYLFLIYIFSVTFLGWLVLGTLSTFYLQSLNSQFF